MLEPGWYLLHDYDNNPQTKGMFTRLAVPAVNNTQLASETAAKQAARRLMEANKHISNPLVVWITNL